MSSVATKTVETNKIVPSKIKAGDIMNIIHYFKVKQNNGSHIIVTDLKGKLGDMKIDGLELIESCGSADQWNKEEKCTMTAAAQMLVESYGKPFSCTFLKADGTERTLRGKLVTPEPLLGRSSVIDLDIPAGEHNLRLIDHRTVVSLTLDGVKYTVKK